MKSLLDLVLPPLCPLCHAIVPDKHTLCPSCWSNLNFISSPFCIQCGIPFEVSHSESISDTLKDPSFQKCLKCLQAPPFFSETRSVYVYDDFSKKMILSFKHGNLALAPFFAEALSRSGKDVLNSADTLIPVPLHWRRLYQRGFNQAALLACYLKKITKKTTELNVLKRIRPTPSQGTLPLEERIKNVENCFRVSRSSKIEEKSILLIDDVMTTGATLNACAKALLKAGCLKVMVLCVARVKIVK